MIQNKRSISAETLDRLKDGIFQAMDRTIESHTDCEMLASRVENLTGRSIGITTLRRFFGFDPAKTLPSVYTLDTLSIFCGFKSWRHFADSLDSGKAGHDHINSQTELTDWDSLSRRADSISQLTLKAVKNKVGIPWHDAIERRFATDFLLKFLKSDKTATAFIAPGGYGKSTLLAKSVEKLWLGDCPLCPDDIVWFIDGGILNGLVSKGYDLNQWIASQLGMEPEKNYREFFRNNPALRKGRMLLVVDSIEDILSKSEQNFDIINSLISLIASNENSPWFKVVITMRNVVWDKFVLAMNSSPSLQNQWQGVAFKVYKEDSTNIPPFTLEEIQNVVDNIGARLPQDVYTNLKQIVISGDFNHILSFPYFLQIFISVIQDRGTAPESDTDLFTEFVRTRICRTTLGQEKHYIIQSMLKEMDMGLKGLSVNKKHLMKDIYVKNNLKAYHELVSFGVLREEIFDNSFGTTVTQVEFTHKILMDFLIAAEYVNNTKLSISTFEYILKKYENSDLKLDIITWLVKLAFNQREYDVIFNLKKILRKKEYLKKSEHEVYYNEFWQVIRTIGVCLRYNPKARKELIPRFAADIEWQEWYFETFVDVDYLVQHFGNSVMHYLLYRRTPESILFGHSLLLFKNLLEMNFEEAGKQIEILEQVEYDPHTLHPILLGRLLGFSIMYYHMVDRRESEELVKKAVKVEEQIYEYCKLPEYVPAFHASVMAGFNFAGKYDLTIHFWDRMQSKYKEYLELMRIPEIELAKISYADALLAKGETDKAEEILKTYSGNFYNTTRNSYNIYYNGLQARIMLLKGRREEACALLEQALLSSKQFGNKLLEKQIRLNFSDCACLSKY